MTGGAIQVDRLHLSANGNYAPDSTHVSGSRRSRKGAEKLGPRVTGSGHWNESKNTDQGRP